MVDLFRKGCSNVGVGMTSMFKTSFIWTGPFENWKEQWMDGMLVYFLNSFSPMGGNLSFKLQQTDIYRRAGLQNSLTMVCLPLTH